MGEPNLCGLYGAKVSQTHVTNHMTGPIMFVLGLETTRIRAIVILVYLHGLLPDNIVMSNQCIRAYSRVG